MKKEPLIIYWSPYYPADVNEKDWNMLYSDPYNLYTSLTKSREKASKEFGFFSCPAVQSRLKNTFVFTNNLHSEYSFDGRDLNNVNIFAKTEQHVLVNPFKPTSIKDGFYFAYNMAFTFFCEESVIAQFGPPTMTKPKYTNYGTVISGEFDISKWIRPFVIEFQTWDNFGDFIIEKDEPLFYLEIKTDRPIVLKRFVMTEKLDKIIQSCVSSPSIYGKYLPLIERYKNFTKTSTDKIVLKEIKENLLD
jgi:hypothetical protein